MATKKTIRQAKAGKIPLSSSQAKDFKRLTATDSATKISEREVGKSRTARHADTRPKKVTMDKRSFVAKGSKASGVAVNGRMVRQGKVKAAESVVRKGVRSAAIKTVARVAARAIPVVGTALLIADTVSFAKKSLSAKKPKATKIRGKK